MPTDDLPTSHSRRPGEGAVGIFDSGIGGLTVLKAIRQALPAERLLYFGDNAHVPYGPRSLEEVRGFSHGITRALLDQGCKLIVIACNTASAAALTSVREAYPQVPFVGMEPAVKPAVEHTRTGVVGVIATVATFQSELYASVVERFGVGVEVLHQPCPGLVKQIEAGEFDTPLTESMLRGWLEPMLARHIDALVLACTHYPIVRPLIERIVGPDVRVIDPAPAIARQVKRVLEQAGQLAAHDAPNGTLLWTSGEPSEFAVMMARIGMPRMEVRGGKWENSALLLV
ncbi:MAG: glutamate racemase [Flavobacteriales bacterium]|nr:glutamate racemase [Flavobacteriales bacterium]MBP6696027.1 glutamate racemase [Flavobacteriales bacterium]